jgi:hypothetical protein
MSGSSEAAYVHDGRHRSAIVEYLQVEGEAGGARTHDRRIMRMPDQRS